MFAFTVPTTIRNHFCSSLVRITELPCTLDVVQFKLAVIMPCWYHHIMLLPVAAVISSSSIADHELDSEDCEVSFMQHGFAHIAVAKSHKLTVNGNYEESSRSVHQPVRAILSASYSNHTSHPSEVKSIQQSPKQGSMGISTQDQCLFNDAAEKTKNFILSFRLIYVVVSVSILNQLWEWCERHIRRKSFAAYADDDKITLVTARLMRAFIAPLLMLGLVTGTYHLLSGCSVGNIYIFCLGWWAGLADFWEWVRAWPRLLRNSDGLLFHHVGVLATVLIITECPEGARQSIESFQLTFIIACIGVQWLGDWAFANVWLASDLPTVMLSAKLAVWSGIPRVISLLMQIWLQYNNLFVWRSWTGLVFGLPLLIGYAWLQYNVVRFYWFFDPTRFFESHQKTWLEESKK